MSWTGRRGQSLGGPDAAKQGRTIWSEILRDGELLIDSETLFVRDIGAQRQAQEQDNAKR